MVQLVRTARQLGAVMGNERRRQGLTQQSLSELTGVGQKTISQIEAGKKGVKLETVFALLAALGLELKMDTRSRADDQKIDEIF
jgi:HTH-type transcriptional regulator/antitoxin HipB